MSSNDFDWKRNKYVVIPQGTKIKERMFQGNKIVETIVVPDDVTFLPEYFCFNCPNLKAILGGKNVKAISYNSFVESTNLHHLDFIPQIGYKRYDPTTKGFVTQIIRNLRINDFDFSYESCKDAFGYIIHKQRNEYLIWDIKNKKFAYTVSTNLFPVFSYVKFTYVYAITYNEDLRFTDIERNYVENVCVENDEDREKVIFNDDLKKYILGELQLYSKISTMHKILSDYVQSLNIDSIIDSYTVSVEEFIRTKVGGDDTYFMTEKAICDYNHSDTYLKKILPTYSNETRESGYCSFSYMSEEEKKKYKLNEKRIKTEARLNYSQATHVNTLMNSYIEYLCKRVSLYRSVLGAIKTFKKNRMFIVGSDDLWENIPNFTMRLNS